MIKNIKILKDYLISGGVITELSPPREGFEGEF